MKLENNGGIIMDRLKISRTKDYFECNGRRVFYLADTVWSAFSNASPEEWEEYLEYRKTQGFNVLQINILKQWDASESDIDIFPFGLDSRGNIDFYSFNEKYFKRAQEMLEKAAGKGFIPALVVLWCDYVKDTWASSRVATGHIMPMDAVKPYVEYIVGKFSRFNPIYIVSGDTNFESKDAVKYYEIALETLKLLDPGALTTLHLGGGLVDLPVEFVNSPHLDFYMYQSGHRFEEQHFPYKMAEDFCRLPVKRPVLNGEPCYEGHGHGNKYGRFNDFDIRKATWQSLLSGAKAGITYGAHGIWGWHKKGKKFPSEQFSSKPYDWRTALRLKGAWDVAFARQIFEKYNLFDIEPANLILNKTAEIRAAISQDKSKIAIYVPYSVDVEVNMDLSGYSFELINLAARYFVKPEIKTAAGVSTIKMHDFNTDVLLIGIK